MGTIICATRFGVASRSLRSKAIQTAAKGGDKLVFVYVIHPQILGDEADKGYAAAESEIRWFANALLNIAQRRGNRQGVEVETIVRKGEVAQEIEQVIRQYNAETLIIGRPTNENERPGYFMSPKLDTFTDRIAKNTGAEVKIFESD